MNLYAFEYGAKISTENGKVKVTKDGVELAQYPIEVISSLTLSDRCQITSQCLEKLTEYGADVLWVGYTHSPMGMLMNPKKCNIIRQKAQFDKLDDVLFRTEISRSIVLAKVNNQRVLLQRYCRDKTDVDEIKQSISELKRYMKKIPTSDADALMGYEGYCSRLYFNALRRIVPKEFEFKERTKNPPQDCFSALLSFLYTLLFNEILICVIHAGLNPYVGLMHELKNNHPALVSDLMEEWRGVIADSIAVKLVTSHAVTPDDFQRLPNGAVYLNHAACKKVIAGFEKKLASENTYLQREGFGKTYRDSFAIQTAVLCDALENDDAALYSAVEIR